MDVTSVGVVNGAVPLMRIGSFDTLHFTFEEYKAYGVTEGRHPSTMVRVV
jgi:hypothetical protein